MVNGLLSIPQYSSRLNTKWSRQQPSLIWGSNVEIRSGWLYCIALYCILSCLVEQCSWLGGLLVKTGVYFTATICPHYDSKPRPDIDTENTSRPRLEETTMAMLAMWERSWCHYSKLLKCSSFRHDSFSRGCLWETIQFMSSN